MTRVPFTYYPVTRPALKIRIFVHPFAYFRPIQASSQGFQHEIMISLYLFSNALRSYLHKFHRTFKESPDPEIWEHVIDSLKYLIGT